MAQDGDHVVGYCEHGDESLGSTKCRAFLH